MKQKTYVPTYFLHGTENNQRAFSLTFAVSTLCHIVFFAVLLFFPGRTPDKAYFPAVINVSIVTLPAVSATTEMNRPGTPEMTMPAKPRDAVARPEPQPAKVVSLAPNKDQPKRSLKKKTFKSSKVVESAIKQIEKKVAETKTDSLQDALSRLEREVGKTEARGGLETKSGTDNIRDIPGGSGVTGKKVLELIDIYRVEIAYQVQKNWAFSGQLAGTSDLLQASLVFKVMPNGEIREIFYTDRSGNKHLDDSAYKAIAKSNPVNPHPLGIVKPYVEVGLRFTPEGVR